MITLRIRSIVWFVTGALLAVTVMMVMTNAWRVDAAPGDADTTFVPLSTPCRLIDTRPVPARVGTAGAFSADDTRTLQATGANGECTIPADAVGLALNVTATNSTSQSFLTLWPGGTRPKASNLNPEAGAPPTPNAANVTLSATGTFNIYNFAGTVDVIVDINGYSTKTSLQEITSRLNALEAAQPFTVASEPVDIVGAASTPTAIRQVTVTAPVDGHVATIASGYMGENTDGQVVECGMMAPVPAPPADVEVRWQSPTGGDQSNLSASRVFDIAAGATATYTLVCYNRSGGESGINSPRVMAIFTPAP